MPRLTHATYIARYINLRTLWTVRSEVFSILSARDQWYLHDYFAFAKELTNDELRTHRLRVSQQRPELPHCAGRALATLRSRLDCLQRLPETQQVPLAKNLPRAVNSVVLPEVDVERVARVLCRLIEQELGIGAATGPEAASSTLRHAVRDYVRRRPRGRTSTPRARSTLSTVALPTPIRSATSRADKPET